MPNYFNGDIREAADSEFEALLGYPIPPADYPTPRRLSWDSTLEDATQSPFGRLLVKIIDLATPVVQNVLGDSIGDTTTVIESLFEMPIRTMAQWSGGFLNAPMAEALVSIFNEENYLRSAWELVKGGAMAAKKAWDLGRE